MNGSLPPISRLMRATRSAHAAAIRLPVSIEPVKATQSTPSSADDPGADLAGAGEQVDDARRQVLEARRERQGGERRQLRGLADRGVAGGQRRRQLPGQEQQRIVPGHDAGDHADRLLDHQRQLGRLDRGNHPAGRVAADLRVVVEGGRRPADLVRVLDQRLAALQRHQLGELVAAGAEPGGDLVQELGALDRRCSLPVALRLARRGDRRRDLLVRGRGHGRDRLLGGRVLDRQRLALAGDLLAADQQPRLGLLHGAMLPGVRSALAHERLPPMTDEWRVEVDLEDEQHGLTLGERLRSLDLDDEARERLGDRVVVTRDGPRMFLYAATEQQAREAERVARDLVAAEGLSADTALTRWHPDEEAWKDPSVPLPVTEEERAAERERHESRRRERAGGRTSGRFGWTCRRCARRSSSPSGSRTRASRCSAAGGTCWWARRPRIGAAELAERIRARRPRRRRCTSSTRRAARTPCSCTSRRTSPASPATWALGHSACAVAVARRRQAGYRDCRCRGEAPHILLLGAHRRHPLGAALLPEHQQDRGDGDA